MDGTVFDNDLFRHLNYSTLQEDEEPGDWIKIKSLKFNKNALLGYGSHGTAVYKLVDNLSFYIEALFVNTAYASSI